MISLILGQMQALRARMFVDPFLEAVVHLGLGETKGVFAALDDAFQVRSAFLISLKSDPKWDGWRGDARFRAMLQRIGFNTP